MYGSMVDKYKQGKKVVLLSQPFYMCGE